MILLKKLFYLTPLFIIAIEIIYLLNFQKPFINPLSSKNYTINQIMLLLQTANIKPTQTIIRDFENEIEFYLKNSSGTGFLVIFSTNKNATSQVTALQKLIKIANIKGKELKFIDLSSSHPNATF